MGCVYLITCGKVEYVGSTTNLLRRMKSHRSVLSLGQYGNSPLQIAYKEVGDFTYKVLEDDVSAEDCGQWTAHIGEHYRAYLNISGEMPKVRRLKRTQVPMCDLELANGLK